MTDHYDLGRAQILISKRIGAVCSLLITSAVLQGVACNVVTKGPRIIGREIPSMTANQEQYKLCNAVAELIDSKTADDDLEHLATKAIQTCQPGLVATLMIQLENWGDTQDKRLILDKLVGTCLSNPDVMIRWSGMRIVRNTRGQTAVCATIERDLDSLMVRPDYRSHGANYIDWASPAVSLAAVRADLIRLIPECRLSAGVPILEAIVNDRHEWHEPTLAAARESLNAMKGMADREPK